MDARELWAQPVKVLITGKTYIVRRAWKAAELLVYHWPAGYRDGAKAHAAKVACVAELEGKGKPAKARAAFIAAAKEAKVVLHEADEPYSVVGLFDPDALSGEDGAEVDFALFVANSAAGCDRDGFVMEGIVEVGQASIGSGRRAVELGRTAHTEGLVGSLGVVKRDAITPTRPRFAKSFIRGIPGLGALFMSMRWSTKAESGVCAVV